MGDFFAPRCRNRSKEPGSDEIAASDEKTTDAEPRPQVSETVKTEHVRRSSRLSAQAAATAIARALQVTLFVCL